MLRSLALLLLLVSTALAQRPDPRAFLSWRGIGPGRGSRVKAAIGVSSRPGTFYFGAVNGGLWRSTDYGRTWKPIMDDAPNGSVGAIDVAQSNPDIIYVGSGEGMQRPDLSTGDGIYKSVDNGRTWVHLGLRDAQQIPRLIVDPVNPNRLFVAALGHPYGPNAERGIFRSLDGGASFQKVLYKDENTGGAEVMFAPDDPNTVYAVLWEARQAPWENGAFAGPGSGLYKSTDGGTTWRQLTNGLPNFERDQLGRIGLAISPSNPRRMYATADAGRAGGVYKSDDAGETWTRTTADNRYWGRASDFAALTVDPRNPDVVYSANVVTWKSTDAGVTWTAFRGAPGGDDYQRLWIDPVRPSVMLLVADQGAIVTVNGGETWSSWYNQPTAQFYHVTADNAYPYRLCGGQQESGSACVASRGNDGAITFREFHPAGFDEYGYAAPDPLDPDIVYGARVERYDRRTGQVTQVAPVTLRNANYRTLRTAPLLFSPTNPRKLYFASNTVWQTVNGGMSWKEISPDLTRTDSVVPPNVGVYAGQPAARARHRGVVYALAPSPVDSNTIWAGTDDGLIQVTRNNGRSWTNVTPPGLVPWAKVSIMDASHFDANTAYAAVNTLRLDDLRPHLWRTRDGGKSWTEIVNGIPAGTITNVVREDPKRRGLLYTGTEQTVFVSYDDGDHWQSLRRNLPPTSVRDLVVKDDDIAVGTHGRGFWILDNVTTLRQHDAAPTGDALLYAPARATRVRWNMNTDTPLPPDEPTGDNPPDGTPIDYWLGAGVRGPVVIEIVGARGAVVRRISSDDAPEPRVEGRNIPDYWIRPPQVLSAAPGEHRYYWNVRHAPPQVANFGYPIAAVYLNTPREPEGSWVLPGRYTVRLTVNGTTQSRPLDVRLDPRVKTPAAALATMYATSRGLDSAIAAAAGGQAQVRAVRDAIRARREKAGSGAVADALAAFDTRLATLEGTGGTRLGGGGARSDSFAGLRGELGQLFGLVENADTAPTTQLAAAVRDRRAALARIVDQWASARGTEVPRINAQLKAGGLEELPR